MMITSDGNKTKFGILFELRVRLAEYSALAEPSIQLGEKCELGD